MSIADKIIRAKTDYDEVYDAGKQAEYDRFWDNHPTGKGVAIVGENIFSGPSWNDETFKPKRDIIIKDSAYMLFKGCAITDIPKSLNECGVKLDLSRAYSYYYAWYQTKTTHIGEIPLTLVKVNAYTTSLCADSTKLHTIDKIIVIESTFIHATAFGGCTSLANIAFEGVIGTSLALGDCPLTRASVLNIFEHYSTTKTGLTLTLNLNAVNKAFETSDGALDGSSSDEFTALKATRPNLAIAYK